MKTNKFKIKTGKHSVTARVKTPADPKKTIILANGAGANMDSTFMQFFQDALAEKYRVVCFNFVYQEIGKRSPDRQPMLEATFKDVIEFILQKYKIKPASLTLAGKSMGGRIASHVADEMKIKKLVFLGYPLHPPGKQDSLRDKHLYGSKAKMLFLSGTRDTLCKMDKLKPVLKKLPNATLIAIEDGDHSFKVPKKSGRSHEEVLGQAALDFKKFVR